PTRCARPATRAWPRGSALRRHWSANRTMSYREDAWPSRVTHVKGIAPLWRKCVKRVRLTLRCHIGERQRPAGASSRAGLRLRLGGGAGAQCRARRDEFRGVGEALVARFGEHARQERL